MDLNIINLAFKNEQGFINKLKAIPKIFKYSVQRITKGYCDYDLEDIRKLYLKYLSLTLNDYVELKDIDDFPEDMTAEEWNRYLRSIADNLEFAYILFYEHTPRREDLTWTKTSIALEKLDKRFLDL